MPGYDRWFDGEFTKAWGAKQRHRRHRRPHHGDRGQRAGRGRGGRAEGPRPLPLHVAAGGLREPGHRPSRDRRGGRAAAREDDPARRRSPPSIPKTGKYFAFSDSYVPDPGNYRIDLWSGGRFPERARPPGTTCASAAARSRRSSATPSASASRRRWTRTWRCARCSGPSAAPSRTSRGASSLDSKETVEALKFARALYRETETAEVFTWDPSSNNRAILAGRASFVQNAISVTRTAEKENPAIARKIGLLPALAGPGSPHRLRARHELLRHLEVRGEHRRRQAVPGRPRRRLRVRLPARASSTTSPAIPSTVPNLAEQLAGDPKADPPGKYCVPRGRRSTGRRTSATRATPPPRRTRSSTRSSSRRCSPASRATRSPPKKPLRPRRRRSSASSRSGRGRSVLRERRTGPTTPSSGRHRPGGTWRRAPSSGRPRRGGTDSVGRAHQNCALSVESASAVVEAWPAAMTLATSSK